MIRFLLCLILATAFLVPLSLLADERILEYRSDIHVHENGQLTVTELIRVRAEGQNIRRGIYRDFPHSLPGPAWELHHRGFYSTLGA